MVTPLEVSEINMCATHLARLMILGIITIKLLIEENEY
jgi:hypothetical protein